MRINPSIMTQNARQLVRERTAQDRSIVCVYLAGSLLDEDNRLGGAGDIDLVFVHAYPNGAPRRELLRLSDEVHFDLLHRAQSEYSDPRALRRQPWLGCDLWRKPTVFFEQNHWFDFVLAGAFSQFDSPENSLWRARAALQNARRQQMAAYQEQDAARQRLRCLRAVEEGANALALLESTPLGTRRLLLDFPQRAAALDAPQWTAQLIGQFSQELPARETLAGWIDPWRAAYRALQQPPLELHPLKENYYAQAAAALVEETPAAALWILLRTWAALDLPGPQPAESAAAYEQLLHTTGLADADLEARFDGLDAWLDGIAETMDELSSAVGLAPVSEWEPAAPPADVADWENDWADMGGTPSA
jgi:hypothetical protein